MAFSHNSKLADSEPRWGGIDKTKLPRIAHADTGEPGLKTSWRFPHHWVKGGGGLSPDGVFTTGTMFLHEGGLNAAWSRANQKQVSASSAVKAHLQAHRRALGKDTGSRKLSSNSAVVSSYTPRQESFEGRSCIAVPVSLLVEGVHAGNKGPMFYPKSEISKFPQAWNGVPVPIDHPVNANGIPCSCNDPTVIEKRVVGRLWNCAYTGDKLKGEIWVDVEKLSEVSPGTLSRIQDGGVLEVSTAFYSDEIPALGEWNGETYEGRIANLRPDHLAILPDTKGACSVEDGCGIGINIKGGKMKSKVPFGVVRNMQSKAGWLTPDTAKKLYRGFVAGLNTPVITNVDVSFDDIRTQLWSYLQGIDTDDLEHYIKEVYVDKFIYTQEPGNGSDLGPAYYSLDYTVDTEGEVSVGKTPVEVIYKKEYIPVKDAQTEDTDTQDEGVASDPAPEPSTNQTQKGNTMANQNTNTKKECPECKDVIKQLMEVPDTPLTNADTEWLDKMPLDQLKKLLPRDEDKQPMTNTAAQQPPDSASMPAPAPAPVADADPLSGMPEQVRMLVNDALQAKEQQKKTLIAAITANAKNSLSEEQLLKLSVNVLQNMVELSPSPSYLGAAGTVIPVNADSGITALGMPSLKEEAPKTTN
jgi:hypothetical protein